MASELSTESGIRKTEAIESAEVVFCWGYAEETGESRGPGEVCPVRFQGEKAGDSSTGAAEGAKILAASTADRRT